MVSENAQMYTIEGVAAGVLILVTVYLVINSTSLFTPGDSHIVDMQLEQIGNDALAMMDTPDTYNTPSELSNDMAIYISTRDPAAFHNFWNYVNLKTGGSMDHLKYYVNVYYRNDANVANPDEVLPLTPLPGLSYSHYRENAVTVKRWVYVPGDPADPNPLLQRKRMVLLEVVLWRE